MSPGTQNQFTGVCCVPCQGHGVLTESFDKSLVMGKELNMNARRTLPKATGGSMVSMRRVRGKLVLAASLVVVGSGNIAWADHTHGAGRTTMYAEGECGDTACDGYVSVGLNATCDGVNCTVTPETTKSGDCDGVAIDVVTVCQLHDTNNSVTDCVGDDATPIDLLVVDFMMTEAEWNDVLAGVYVMVAEVTLVGGATASGEGSVAKRAIPTVSSWGVMVMIGLLLVAGTVVFRRSRPELT